MARDFLAAGAEQPTEDLPYTTAPGTTPEQEAALKRYVLAHPDFAQLMASMPKGAHMELPTGAIPGISPSPTPAPVGRDFAAAGAHDFAVAGEEPTIDPLTWRIPGTSVSLGLPEPLNTLQKLLPHALGEIEQLPQVVAESFQPGGWPSPLMVSRIGGQLGLIKDQKQDTSQSLISRVATTARDMAPSAAIGLARGLADPMGMAIRLAEKQGSEYTRDLLSPATRLREQPIQFLLDLSTAAAAPSAVSSIIRGPVSSALKTTANSAADEALASANTFGQSVAKGNKSFGGTRPMFWRFIKEDPEIHQALTSAVAAPEEKTWLAAEAKQSARHFAPAPEVREAFGKAVVADNLASVEGGDLGEALAKVKWTPADSAAAQQPTFKALAAYWKQKFVPIVESFRPGAQIEGYRDTGLGYAKLTPTEFAEGAAPRGAGLPQFGKKISTAAMQAKGTATAYETDLDNLIDQTLGDRVFKARQNELIDAVKAREVPRGTPGSRGVPLERFGKVNVPGPVADAYEQALVGRNAALSAMYDPEGLGFANKLGTSIYLATPAEAVAHGMNVLGALERAPGVGGQLGRFSGPIAREMGGVARAVKLEGPEFADEARNLARFGALRTSHLAGYTSNAITGAIEKIPGYGSLVKASREAIFGMPDLYSSGVQGFETRARVATGLYLKEAGITNAAERAAIINNEFGTYVKGLEPTMVRVLRGVPFVGNPFAASTVALGKGGVKSILGIPMIKAAAGESLFNRFMSLPLMHMAMNRAIDGRWPWEIPGLAPGAIRLHKDDGSTVDIPMRLWAPAAARGQSQLGIGSVIQDIAAGETDPTKYAQDVMIGTVNTVAHQMGPVAKIVLAGLGKVPHITPAGELMQNPEGSGPVAALRALSRPAGEVAETATGAPGGEPLPSSLPVALATKVLPNVGLTLKVGGPESELVGARIRGENAKLYKRAEDTARDIKNMDDDTAKVLYISTQADRYYPNDPASRMRFKQQVARAGQKKLRSTQRSAAQAEAHGAPPPMQ